MFVNNQQNSVCRICLRKLAVQYYIFENNIKQMLESLLNKDIIVQQNTSVNICVSCFLHLKTAYNFQQNITNRETVLSIKVEDSIRPVKSVKSQKNIEQNNFKIEDELVVLCENPCLFCGQVCGLYDDDLLINGHIRNHFQDVQTCQYCRKKFVNVECLRRHVYSLKNHGSFKKVHQCEQCNARFRYKSFFDEHVNTACKQAFEKAKRQEERRQEEERQEAKRQEQRRQEEKRQKEERQEEERQEKKQLEKENIENAKKESESRQIKYQLLPVVNNPKSTFKFCYVCQKHIPHSAYRDHCKDHPIDQLCHFCGKILPNMRKLRGHLQSHGKIEYKCENCDRVFRYKFRKDAHLQREHLNQFSHFCKKCGKGFFSQLHMKKHSDRHLQLREHVCEHCKKKFSTRFALKVHSRKHTNETPYKCKICSEGFRYKVSLKTHLKSKHGIEDFTEHTCKTCGKEFGTLSGLHSHMRIHK